MGDRKVILIKGDGSKWYDEVIFIVKSNADIPRSPAAEAERIIKNYISNKYVRSLSSERNLSAEKSFSSKEKTEKQNEIRKRKKRNEFAKKVIDICLILVLIALAILVFMVIS